MTEPAGDIAPNGAAYRVSTTTIFDEEIPAVIRTWNGQRDVIVGGILGKFDSQTDAEAWAECDGRFEMPGNRPYSQRKFVAA